MKIITSITLAMFGVLAVAASGRADMILFDDAPTTGLGYFNSTQSNEQAATGTYSMKMVRGAYSEAGMIGGSGAIPSGLATLSYQFYLVTGGVSGVTLILSDNSQVVYDNSKSAWWTVDGSAGASGLLTTGSWHTITFDLTLNPNFVSGVSGLARIAPKPGGSGFTAYMDDVRVIPEPATLALLAGGMTLIGFRRRRV